MRNAILPPVSPQFYSFGNSDAQISNMDAPKGTDRNLNFQGSSVFWEPTLSGDWNHQISGSFSIPFQPIIEVQPSSVNPSGYQSTSSDMKTFSYESMLSRKTSVPEIELNGAIKLRKRPHDFAAQTAISDAFELKKARFCRELKERKSVKAKFTDEKLHNLITVSTNVQDDNYKVPVGARRSQKLSDKITALQKLVSPYGKTDTASVLQEASLYIKLLHEQIQNLFDMLCTSHLTEIEEGFPELKRRGLCLAPTPLVQNLTRGDRLHPHE